MSRTPARVSQADWNRAIKAANQSELPCVVEVTPDGTIRIIPSISADATGETVATRQDWSL
jgi:hypothetical protein